MSGSHVDGTLTLYLMSIISVSKLKVVMACRTDNTILVGDYGWAFKEKITFFGEKMGLLCIAGGTETRMVTIFDIIVSIVKRKHY